MPDVIPSADPGLLAAQAKAGQAGVDGYNAAIAALQAQKQQAVQTAMQEAALRGAPAGSFESQQSTVTGPYDTRIASLTQGLGSYQASVASREGRMADYSNAVQQARTFIPLQTEQQLAPLRAQNEYNLRSQDIASQRSIGEINANTQLELARIQAGIAAAKRKAAQDAANQNKLNQGQLSAVMGQNAASLVQQKLGGVNSAIAANEADITQQFGNTARNLSKTLGPAQAAQTAVRNQSYWDLLGASYTGKAIEEERQNRPKVQQTARSMVPNPIPGGGTVGNTGAPIIGFDHYGRPIYVEDVPPEVARAILSGQSQPGAPAPDYSAGQRQMSQLQGRVASGMGALGKAGINLNTNLGGAFIQNLLSSLAQQYAAHSSVNQQGQRVLLTPQQIDQLDPFSYSAVMGAPQRQYPAPMGTTPTGETIGGGMVNAPIRGVEAFNREIMGDTGAPGTRYDTGGVADPYSSDVMRSAFGLTGRDLEGQYNITDADVLNAMPDKMPSVHDFLANREGGLSNQDLYSQQVAQQKAQATQETQTGKENEDAFKATLTRLAGRALPPNLGSNADAYDAMFGSGKDDFKAVDDLLKQIIQSHAGDSKPPTTAQLITELEDNGVFDQYLISLALYLNRR